MLADSADEQEVDSEGNKPAAKSWMEPGVASAMLSSICHLDRARA